MLRILLLIALCLPLAVAAQGQWKWRDAQGRIQFSDRPPPQGTPEKDILARPANAPKPVQVVPYGQPASAPPAAPAASTPQERAAANDKARKASESEAKIMAQGNSARPRLVQTTARTPGNSSLRWNPAWRVVMVNERGERVIIDDAQRNQELAKVRAVIAADCR